MTAKTGGGSRKKYLGAWSLICTVIQAYKCTILKNLGGPGQDLEGPVPPGPSLEPPLLRCNENMCVMVNKLHQLANRGTVGLSATCAVRCIETLHVRMRSMVNVV